MITIRDVCLNLNIEPTDRLMWSVGDVMQAKWVDVYGDQPAKQLRPKKRGGGSHCFAVYPHSWGAVISREIRNHENFQARQIDLFI